MDSQKRAFSVGFSEFQSGPMKDALLMVRDGGGTLLSQTLWSVTAFNNYAAGLWITPSGSAAITVGTAVTGNAVNPANMVVTRWLPGTGGAWTAPVQAAVAVLAPAPLDDRAVAVVYSSAGSDAVFTHGTAADTLAGFWGCTAHRVSRHHRYQP